MSALPSSRELSPNSHVLVLLTLQINLSDVGTAILKGIVAGISIVDNTLGEPGAVIGSGIDAAVKSLPEGPQVTQRTGIDMFHA